MPRASEVKKLVSILATSTSITGAREEALERVSCIHYLVQFKGTNKTQVQALINSGNEVNSIQPIFVKELGLPIRPADIGAQKIDGITLDTYGMVVVAFSMTDKANRVRFFEETFLVANISLEVVFEMLFLTLSGADVDFLDRELRWKTYITEKALPTTRRVELVGKKKFAAAALDPKHETFVIYVASLNLDPEIYPDREAQIAFLLTEEAKIPDKYLNFTDIFSEEKVLILPECTELNEHAIDLEDGKQPPYGLIYSLGPMELETLKTYIKTHLKTRFIWPFKSPARAPILFDKKPDGSLHLCVDY